jgi:hypothetical protein
MEVLTSFDIQIITKNDLLFSWADEDPCTKKQNKLRDFWSAGELYRLRDRQLLAKLVTSFVDRVASRDHGGGSSTVVNLSFLDLSRYFCFK